MESAPLPNPSTPLAWLPPNIANQLEASRYLYSATIGAWLWDFMMSLPEDLTLFARYGASLSDIVYVLSRLSTFAFILTSFIFQVAPVGNCHALAKTIGSCATLAISFNTLLFFFRIRAVFNHSRPIVSIFFFLWIATVAGSIAAPFGVDGTHIGTTQNCVNSGVKSFTSAGIVIVAVNDTATFVAISIRLLMLSFVDTWEERLKSFISGRGMGTFSRMLLQSGQLYYLVTVGLNIVAMAVILAPSVPPVLRAMFSIPNVALQNAMACRVFRHVKLGLIKDPNSTFSTMAPIQFVTVSEHPSRPTPNLHSHPDSQGEDFESGFTPSSMSRSHIPGKVEVETINKDSGATEEGALIVRGDGKV